MEYMRLNIVGAEYQVPQEPAVIGHIYIVSVVLGQNRRNTMCYRTYTANTLSNLLSIQRVSASKNLLKAPKHLTRTESPGNYAILNLCTNSEMPLYPGKRINCYCLAHSSPSAFYINVKNIIIQLC